MSHDLNDDCLSRRFDQLRAAESASAPRFSPPTQRSAAPRRTAWAVAAAALVLIGGAAWLLSQRQPTPSEQFAFDLSATVWVAPTDFLLHTPGNELLRGVPRIGLGPSSGSPTATTSEASRIDTSTTERRIQ